MSVPRMDEKARLAALTAAHARQGLGICTPLPGDTCAMIEAAIVAYLASTAGSQDKEVSQHIGWLIQYAEGMDEANWRDMKLRIERQLGELRDRLTSTAAGTPEGWRTMDSAPKDEADVLLYFPVPAWNAAGRSVCIGFWSAAPDGDGDWYMHEYDGRSLTAFDQHPTHWMPLPPPPALPVAGEELGGEEKNGRG